MKNLKNFKLKLIAFLLLALPFSGFSQKGNVGVYFGPSFPMGKYSESNINFAINEVPAAAKIGYQASMDAGYFLADHFGISATLGYSQHDYNKTTLEDLFNSFSISGAFNYTSPHYNIEAGSYKNFFFLFGPMAGFK